MFHEWQKGSPGIEGIAVGLIEALASFGMIILRRQAAAFPALDKETPALVDEPVGGFNFAGPFEAVPDEPVEDRPDAAAPIDFVGESRIIARHRREAKIAAKDESFMDNSPIHDEARWNEKSRTLDCEDVGLNCLVCLDCEML